MFEGGERDTKEKSDYIDFAFFFLSGLNKVSAHKKNVFSKEKTSFVEEMYV